MCVDFQPARVKPHSYLLEREKFNMLGAEGCGVGKTLLELHKRGRKWVHKSLWRDFLAANTKRVRGEAGTETVVKSRMMRAAVV